MVFPEHLSDAIENADEPVSLSVNVPDLVRLQLLSLNPLDTRAPLRRSPKAKDPYLMVPPPGCDQWSDACPAVPWPTAGATSATPPATTTATNSHRVLVIWAVLVYRLIDNGP